MCYDRSMQNVPSESDVKLEDRFDFSFGGGVGTGAFLDSCIGAFISVDTVEPHQTFEGHVLSVERVISEVTGSGSSPGVQPRTVEKYATLHLVETDGRMRHIELAKVTFHQCFSMRNIVAFRNALTD